MSRVTDRLDHDVEATRQVVSVVECFVDSTHSSVTLRRCLDVLADPDLIEVVLEELTRAASFDEAGIDRLEAVVAEEKEDPLAAHAGLSTMPPREERADWLYRKAANYVLLGEPEARSDLVSVVLARADLSTADEISDEVLRGETVGQAAHEPLVVDLVLCELGWFDAFLCDRAVLLPPDELLMGQAWELVQRTAYEVVEVRSGEGLTVRDLRTAETLDVRERTFSRQGHPGMVFCGRAMPVGSHFQFMGGLFAVAPGTEAALLDLLDERDALKIAVYVARLERPPVFQNREGEPLTFRHVSSSTSVATSTWSELTSLGARPSNGSFSASRATGTTSRR